MIDVVFWKWFKAGYRSKFDHVAVNTACRMFARHLHVPHRFTCITDDPSGIESNVRVIDIRTLPSYKWMNVPNPSNSRNPGCYVRLFIFSEEAKHVIGEKIVSCDLDLVAVNDLDPIFDRDVDFAIWGGQTVQPKSPIPYCWYNGSLMMIKAGTRTRVYDEFDPKTSPSQANAAGCRGSDQGWISFCLGAGECTWGTRDGVYSYRNHILPAGGRLPKEARIVAFHGLHDPWHRDVQARHSWIREHYR